MVLRHEVFQLGYSEEALLHRVGSSHRALSHAIVKDSIPGNLVYTWSNFNSLLGPILDLVDCPSGQVSEFIPFRQPCRNPPEHRKHRRRRGHERTIVNRYMGKQDPSVGIDNRVANSISCRVKSPGCRAVEHCRLYLKAGVGSNASTACNWC